MKITKRELKQMINEAVVSAMRKSIHKRPLNENVDSEGNINLDCTVTLTDKEFGEISAANLYFDNDKIVIRWVTNNGADCTGLLLDEDEETIWEIIKSIR